MESGVSMATAPAALGNFSPLTNVAPPSSPAFGPPLSLGAKDPQRPSLAVSRGVVLPALDTSHNPAGRRRASLAPLQKAELSTKVFQSSGKSEAAIESSLDIIYNHISTNIALLAQNDQDAWKDFNSLTRALYNRDTNDDKPLFALLTKYGFKPDSGWAPVANEASVNLDALSEALGGMYLAEKSKYQDADALAHINVKNFQSLSFLPNVIFSNFGTVFDSKPHSVSFESAVLLADISGFSKFAGTLCSLGKKGLDDLHKVTSEFLGLFVRTVYEHGGDVIAFAGDALVCIFPTTEGGNALAGQEPVTFQEACAQGLKCAYDLREAKMSTLSAHFALSCGPIQIALLGGINDEWTYLMNGACLADLSVCIDTAKSEQVVCTPECFQQAHAFLQNHLTASETSTGQMLITSIQEFCTDNNSIELAETAHASVEHRLKLKPSGSKSTRAYSNISDDFALQQLVAKAKYFVSKPVLTSMSAGSLNTLPDLRRITTMFVNLDSYSLKENVDPLSLQPFFQLFQDILSKSGGYLRQFLIDDKGCVVIALWGVPCYTHQDDCYRGLYCAWNLWSRISEVNHRVSIGLTTGMAYCGIVGSNLRRDYAGIGDKVNIAARLMGKAKSRVLVDPDVYAQLESQEKQCLLLDKELQLKGMSNPLTPYTFTAAADLSMLRNTEDDPSSILRVEVVEKILSVLDEANASTPFFGKTVVSKTADLNSAILVGKSAEGDDSPLTPDKDGPHNQPTTPNGKGVSFQRSLSEIFTNIGGKKSSSKSNLTGTTNNGASPSPNVSEPNSPMAMGGLGRSGGLGPGPGMGALARSGNRRQSFGQISFKAPDKNNRIIILTGPSGTGKSQAADFFKQSCMRRKFKVATVICRAEDEQSPFSVARHIFWEFAGPDKHSTMRQKREFVVDLVDQVHSELDDNEDMAKEDLCHFLLEVLIEPDDSITKKRMSVVSAGNVSISNNSALVKAASTLGRFSASVDESSSANHSNLVSSRADDDTEEENAANGESKAPLSSRPVTARGETLTHSGSSQDMNFDDQQITFTPEEIGSFFIKLLQTLLSNHPATFALILKKAHYCDEISWKILAEMQKVPMKLILLITIQQAASLSQNNFSMNAMGSISGPNTAFANDPNKRRQSLAMGSAMEERTVSATVIKRCLSEAKAGQSFTDSVSYSSIIKDDRTTVIELSGLNEHEVRDVLCHVLKTTPAELPNDLVVRVLIMTSGNAFWVKAIARFIREYGVSSFLETIQRGNAMDALKSLIICRLEKITPEQQMVIKHASVIGQEFSLRTLAAVVPAVAIPKLKKSLVALVENGFIYAMQESSMSIYGFHNAITRETIYDLIPPSDASEMHLKAAEYIEKQFAANLSRFYSALSYHYSNAEDQEANAFKYTCKAADAIIMKGAFRLGLDLLLTAQEMCTTTEEFSIVLKICNRGIKEIKRSNSKGSKKGIKDRPVGFPVSSQASISGVNNSREGPLNVNRLSKEKDKEKESPYPRSTSGRLMSLFTSSPLKTIHSPRNGNNGSHKEENDSARASKDGEGSSKPAVPGLAPTVSFRRSLIQAISTTFGSLASPQGSGRTPTQIDVNATPGRPDPLSTSPATHLADVGSQVSTEGGLLQQYTNLAEELEGDVEMMMEYDNQDASAPKIIIGAGGSSKTATAAQPQSQAQMTPRQTLNQKVGLASVKESQQEYNDDPDAATATSPMNASLCAKAGVAPPATVGPTTRLSQFERTFSFLGRNDSNNSTATNHPPASEANSSKANTARKSLIGSARPANKALENVNDDGSSVSISNNHNIGNVNHSNPSSDKGNEGNQNNNDDESGNFVANIEDLLADDADAADFNVELGVSTKHLKVLSKPQKKPLTTRQRFFATLQGAKRSAGGGLRRMGRAMGACGYFIVTCGRSRQEHKLQRKRSARAQEIVANSQQNNNVHSNYYKVTRCMWMPRMSFYSRTNRYARNAQADDEEDEENQQHHPKLSNKASVNSNNRSCWNRYFCSCFRANTATVKPIGSGPQLSDLS